MFMYDNGELFWTEGGNVALARWGSREDWARIPPERKLEAVGPLMQGVRHFLRLSGLQILQ